MSENHTTQKQVPLPNSSQTNLSDISQRQAIILDQDRIKLSRSRWLILLAVAVFGFTSALCSELSPILNIMTKLLDVTVHQYIYISQISYYLLVVLAMPTAWCVDRYGIRASIYVATMMMLIRNGMRALLFYPDSPDWEQLKMFYFIVSHIISTLAFTLFFCLPLKISELWFAASERSIAWTLMMSAMGLGVSLGAVTFPRYIRDDLQNIQWLAYLNVGCALVTGPIVLLGVTKSEPEHPASERVMKSASLNDSYLKTVKKMVTQKDIILHTLHGAIFEGFQISISALLQDLYLSMNKSKVFVGDLIAVNSILAIVMLIVLSTFVHRSKNPTLTCKLGAVFQTATLIAYIATMQYPMANWIVMLISFISTISKSWFTPNSTNMTALLACGTVSQATITGFGISVTLIISLAIQTVFVSLATEEPNDKRDYTNSFLFAIILSIINSVLYLILFKGKPSSSEEA